MSRVTQREVYRTLLDEYKWTWAEYRAGTGQNPRITLSEWDQAIRKSELLIDSGSIRQKWRTAIAQGVLVEEGKGAARVNLSLIEIKTDMHLPRVGGGRESESVCESCYADARAREGAQ